MPKQVAEAGTPQPAGFVERRRADRMGYADPNLIALMRRPSAEARRMVMVYDAPSFCPPPVQVRRLPLRQQWIRVALAISVCVGLCGAAFGTMLFVWD